jgi:Kef-type K+ transport system membrane component KefB
MTAATPTQMEQVLVATLIQLIVIVLAARVANIVFRRLGQPGVIGEIVAGLLLGPSLFGHLLPDLSHRLFAGPAAVPIQIISQLGLILLMFQIGSEFDFAHLTRARNQRVVFAVALASIAAPLLLGFGFGLVSAPILAPSIEPLTYSLFVAVAMAITALPVLGRILREFGMARTRLGVIGITVAAANDTVGWLLLAAITGLAGARFSAAESAVQLGGIALLGTALWFLGRPLVAWLLRRYPIEAGGIPTSLMAIVLALVFGCGIATYELGLFAIFGGFAAGLLFHRETDFVAAWRRQIGQFVLVFFLPIFFTYTGLRTDVLGLTSASDWLWCGGMTAVAIGAKIVPVFCAGRGTGLGREDAMVLGILMSTRGLTELVVLNIGFDLGFIPHKVFTMLVVMAVTTTIMTAPLLRLVYRRSGATLPAAVEV